MPESQPSLASLLPFMTISDPRRRHPTTLHPLMDIITITILGTLCGAENWVEIQEWAEAKYEWLKQLLRLPNGVPSHDTLSRVFALLSPKDLQDAFVSWSAMLAGKVHGVVALDGKTVRRSLKASDGQGPIHVVSAFASENGLVLAQMKVDDKSNEITALPKIIALLDLKECIVTVDAMGCQVDVAQAIREQGGDYVLAVKENQPTLATETSELFDWALNPSKPQDQRVELVEHRTVEKDHGRIETRHCVGTEDLEGMSAPNRFPGARSLWMIQSRREIGEKIQEEKRYYLSSLPAAVAADATRAAKAIRDHWGIENRVHWILDVAMREDDNRTREGHSAENLALVRKIVLNTLRREKTAKVGLKAKMKKCGWDETYRLRACGLF